MNSLWFFCVEDSKLLKSSEIHNKIGDKKYGVEGVFPKNKKLKALVKELAARRAQRYLRKSCGFPAQIRFGKGPPCRISTNQICKKRGFFFSKKIIIERGVRDDVGGREIIQPRPPRLG